MSDKMLKLIERSELEKILNSHHCNDSGSGDAMIESVAEHFGIEIKKEPEFIDPAVAVSMMLNGKVMRAHFESGGSREYGVKYENGEYSLRHYENFIWVNAPVELNHLLEYKWTEEHPKPNQQ